MRYFYSPTSEFLMKLKSEPQISLTNTIMVSIHNTHVVTPSDTTPSSSSSSTSTLSLSLCDQIKLPNHGSQLYLYTNTSTSTSAIHTLSTSLSKTLTLFYPLAARLHKTHRGHFQILCNAMGGALLIEASCDLQLSFEDLCDFAPKHAIPVIDYDVPIEDIPLLVAQVTRFSCGYVTLGISLCRAVLDGSSATNFFNTWAKFARGEDLDSSLIPLQDRTMLDSRRFNKPPRFQHPEFLPPPKQQQRSTDCTQIKKQLGTAILRVTKVQVQKLKDKACDFGSGYGDNGATHVRGYTSFEVISGYLWRCVCKVRYEGGVGQDQNQDQPTRLTTLVNCRNRLNPSIPAVYFGNATFPTVTKVCSFGDIMHKPLGYAVGKVREAIRKMNDEYVRDALDYIANLEDMDLFRDMFYGSDGKGEFRGDPNLYVVGWTNFKLLETDFGWGKPVCLLPGNINSDGKAFLLDTASGDGFVVAVCLQASLVDDLKKLFHEGIGSTTSKL